MTTVCQTLATNSRIPTTLSRPLGHAHAGSYELKAFVPICSRGK